MAWNNKKLILLSLAALGSCNPTFGYSDPKGSGGNGYSPAPAPEGYPPAPGPGPNGYPQTPSPGPEGKGYPKGPEGNGYPKGPEGNGYPKGPEDNDYPKKTPAPDGDSHPKETPKGEDYPKEPDMPKLPELPELPQGPTKPEDSYPSEPAPKPTGDGYPSGPDSETPDNKYPTPPANEPSSPPSGPPTEPDTNGPEKVSPPDTYDEPGPAAQPESENEPTSMTQIDLPVATTSTGVYNPTATGSLRNGTGYPTNGSRPDSGLAVGAAGPSRTASALSVFAIGAGVAMTLLY